MTSARHGLHIWLALLCGITLGPTAIAAGEARRGAQVFAACAACHSTKPGQHLTGPSLADVWHRKAGTVEGFARYSEAMTGTSIVWTEDKLDKWLANPEALVPGTSMTFAGLKKRGDRQDVIAYLKAVSENAAPPATARSGMMSMGGPKLDLRKAPPQGQVTSIRYCGDAYTVQTADGKSQKVWEFNLRFKTDSSKEGPVPGKPVVIGAGMQGDRASVVFASPEEISGYIKKACK